MNELIIAILIILISFGMFFAIIAILKADKKILELNDKVSDVKNVDFKKFEKVVSVVRKINNTIHLGKVRRIFEIIMTSFSVFNIIFIIKKFSDWRKES